MTLTSIKHLLKMNRWMDGQHPAISLILPLLCLDPPVSTPSLIRSPVISGFSSEVISPQCYSVCKLIHILLLDWQRICIFSLSAEVMSLFVCRTRFRHVGGKSAVVMLERWVMKGLVLTFQECSGRVLRTDCQKGAALQRKKLKGVRVYPLGNTSLCTNTFVYQNERGN